MNPEELVSFVNTAERVGTLSTVDQQGFPNSALVGSAMMPDAEHVHIALSDNHTLANLRQDSAAVLTVYEPAPLIFNWQGARLYLQVETIEDNGPCKEDMIQRVEQQAGKMAARTIHAAVCFRVIKIRPLLDTRG
nr:pyridoxamine 5'-phosphate oxidase family protein [uncultured Desulfuromonas sp.]